MDRVPGCGQHRGTAMMANESSQRLTLAYSDLTRFHPVLAAVARGDWPTLPACPLPRMPSSNSRHHVPLPNRHPLRHRTPHRKRSSAASLIAASPRISREARVHFPAA
jgi:hypothetical protein